MKNYEIMTIAKISIGEDGARSLSNYVKDLISKFKGKVLNNDFWGKRKFAYEIGGETEGFYDIISFEMPVEQLSKFKQKLSQQENLLRYLITAE